MCGSRRTRKAGTYSCGGKYEALDKDLAYKQPDIIPGHLVCLQCGASYKETEINYCQNCGFEFQKCPISKNHFKTADEFAQCGNCLTIFHFHHLQDWLSQHNTCPICRVKLTEIMHGIAGVNRIIQSIST